MSYTKQTYKQPSARLVIIETESLMAIASSLGNENVVKDEDLNPTSTRSYEMPWDSERE